MLEGELYTAERSYQRAHMSKSQQQKLGIVIWWSVLRVRKIGLQDRIFVLDFRSTLSQPQCELKRGEGCGISDV